MNAPTKDDKKALKAIVDVFSSLATDINPMLPAASGIIDLTDEECECVVALVGKLPHFIEILGRGRFICQVERRAVVSTVVELFLERLRHMSQMPLHIPDVSNGGVDREEALIAFDLTECL